MENINYTEKIKNFQAIVENNDEEIAVTYLTKANWDETDTRGRLEDDTATNGRYNKAGESDLEPRESLLPSNNNNTNTPTRGITTNGQEQESFCRRYIINLVYRISKFFCGGRDVDIEEDERIFGFLPEKVGNYNSFSTLIKTRIGILMLYTVESVPYFENLVNHILRESYLVDILRVNFVIYPVLASTPEGQRITSLISDSPVLPLFAFAKNSRHNSTFNRGSIINCLEGEVSFETFRNAVLQSISLVHNPTEEESSNARIIEQQNEEIAALERMEEEKKKYQANSEHGKKETKNIEVCKSITSENQKEKVRKMKELPPEPEKDNPDSSSIIFRYPDGNRRIGRRFLKSDSVKVLYDFVDNLGSDIYTEPNTENYELMQPFPFKLYSNKDATLEEEKLYPNAVLQIREV